MTIGLIGRKAGMTRVFTDAGESIPVTVIEALPNRVTQVKGVEGDGYRAVQVTYGSKKPSRISRSVAGHYAKAKVEPGESLVEFRLADGEGADLAPGSELKVDMFAAGQVVDVAGTTIGKGFAGGMKRWNFGGLRATHGVSVSHRSHGSTGNRQDPGKTFKNKKMAGHLGVERVTTQNLEVAGVDAEKGLVLIKGAVPGAKGGYVLIRDAVKRARHADAPFPAAVA